MTFTVPTSDLQYFDVVNNTMLLESGTYHFLLGASSKDIRLIDTLYINSQPIGTRNVSKTTAFDRYDWYNNAYLHKGPMGYSCVLPKDNTKTMILTYNDVSLSSAKNTIAINYHAITDSQLQIFLGDKLLMEQSLKQTEDFIEIAFTYDESLIPLNVINTLTFKINGYCKLSYYQFRHIQTHTK